MSKSNDMSNSVESNSIRPRTLFFTVISVIFIVLLAAVYISDRISSSLSQASPTNNSLTINSLTKHGGSSQMTPPPKLVSQSHHKVSEVHKADIAISYSDFQQEAQNVLFREEERLVQAKNNVGGAISVVSAEDFRMEAHKILYRDSKY